MKESQNIPDESPEEKNEKQTREERKAISEKIARDTMTGDLRDCILDFMKHDKNPLPWNAQGEEAQRETIAKVEKAVNMAVEKAVQIISSEGRTVVEGLLKKFDAADSGAIKLTVTIASNHPLRHAVLDSRGQPIMLVVAGKQAYEGERAPVAIDPDQKVLPSMEDDDPPVFDKTKAGKNGKK